MGAATTRITREDFLTAPEMHGLSLAAEEAGRIGGLRLTLAADSTGTRLRHCYQQVPLRVLPAFRFGPDRPALLFVLNPTAGLMDGDGQLVKLHAETGSKTVVAGQSATRIHPCPEGYCTQQWHIRAEPGSALVVLPGPAIPFRGCRYHQHIHIELEGNANVVWGDLWLAGRYARAEVSERFQFHTMVQDLRVERVTDGNRTLVFRDRFCWRGPWDEASAAWHFGAAPACGSLFASGPITDDVIQAASLETAVFPTRAGHTCLRWCGSTEEVIRSVVQVALRSAARLDGRTDGAWLDDANLAQAHWFTPVAVPNQTNT
jgi:urease accessory protein